MEKTPISSLEVAPVFTQSPDDIVGAMADASIARVPELLNAYT